MHTLEATAVHAELHARRTATQVARFVPGTRVGHSEAFDHRLEWSMVIPAARGRYVATVTVADDPDTYDRSLNIGTEGVWEGTNSGFHVPGGMSKVFDFGEPVTVHPAVIAGNIVTSLRAFEQASPSLALQVAMF